MRTVGFGSTNWKEGDRMLTQSLFGFDPGKICQKETVPAGHCSARPIPLVDYQ